MRCAVLFAMWVLLFARPAPAQEAVPVALSYSAPSSCPAQGRFVARLRMHTQRVQLSNEADALTLQVVIVRTGKGFSGTLAVAQQGRPSGTRTFEGTECPDVVWALALSAALSIDPEANLTVSSADEASASEDYAGEAGDSAAAPGSENTSSSPAETPDRSASGARSEGPGKQPEPPDIEPPSEEAAEATLWSVGPVLSVSFAFEPKAAIGGGLVAGVRDTTGRHVLPLELALRLEYLGTRLTRGSDPMILDWWSANLMACPLRVGEALTALLCGAGQVGLLHARGVDVERTDTASRSFFSLGLGLWARQRLSEQWELSAVADFKVPLVDRSFALGPDLEVVSSSRPLAVGFSLGAVYGF